MLKIERFLRGELIVFVLSGRIESENLPQLEALTSAERSRFVLDLKEVNLVSRDAVKFLTRCEENGAVLQDCPPYVREWMAGERQQ